MKRTSRQELDELLAALGIERGDNIFVHAFLPSLGIVEGGVKGVIAAMRERLGPEGSLIVPTFTSSYRRSEIYDIAESVSFNGALSEGVRKLGGAVRSFCPLFSMAAIGGDAIGLMARPNKNCFGNGSVYDHLFKNNIKFVCLGIDWDQGFSFFMHLERLAQVPFRVDQTFVGKTRRLDGTLVEDEAVHFVRREDISWKRNRGPFCETLVEKGAIREVIQEGCAHRVADAALVSDITVEALMADPWVMAVNGR